MRQDLKKLGIELGLAKATSKGYQRNPARQLLLSCAVSALMIGTAQAGGALPTGGVFSAGSGTIAGTASTVTVNQATSRGVINWSSFSIGAGNSVQINNGSGATLNRVTGGSVSQIAGSLSATGSVYIVNQAGVVVLPGGQVVSAGSFVASSRDVSDTGFMAGGALQFQGTSSGTVVNQGTITSTGGDVVLIGQSVTNSGQMNAASGTVGLAAGESVLLQPATGDQRVFIATGSGNVTNSGGIAAAQAELNAAGGNVYALAGNNGNIIRATGTASVNGRVWLTAGGSTSIAAPITATNANGSGGAVVAKSTGATSLSSTINVAGGASGGNGGTVELSGHTVSLTGFVDVHSPKGTAGSLLIDPGQINIGTDITVSTLQSQLASGDVTISTDNSGGTGDITVGSGFSWAGSNSLTLSAYHSVILSSGTITHTGSGNLILAADNSATGSGTVSFVGGTINFAGSSGNISIYYNGNYSSPTSFASSIVMGTGTQTAYLLVNTTDDLTEIASDYTLWGNNYGLNADLSGSVREVSDGEYVGGLSLALIGDADHPYIGSFDGRNHTISNFVNVGSTAPDIGLFGVIGATGKVSNLGLLNACVGGFATDASSQHIGGLVGTNHGTISNSYVQAVTQGACANVFSNGDSTAASALGGLAGYSDGTIKSSYATVPVTSDSFIGAWVGGLVGYNTGTIASSYASGGEAHAINGSGAQVGGLAGYNSGTITGSNAAGRACAEGYSAAVGGLVGYADTGSVISTSYASGRVCSDGNSSQVGGLVGANYGSLTTVQASGAVNAGEDQRCGTSVGGLVGRNSGTIDGGQASGPVASFSLGSQDGDRYGGSEVGGLVGTNCGSASGAATAGKIFNSSATGSVCAEGAGSKLGGLVGANGQNAKISASFASTTVVSCANAVVMGGLVGINRTGATISGSHATGTVTSNCNGGGGVRMGGLVGDNEGGTISGAYATGAVTCGSSIKGSPSIIPSGGVEGETNCSLGGLVGYNYGGVITGSHATGVVTGKCGADVGGLVGTNTCRSSIANSYATGTVSVQCGSNVGGLVGTNNCFSSITNSYATGAVTVGSTATGGGYNNVGGLVGLQQCGASIDSSYATGAVTNFGNYSAVGGLVGYNNSNCGESGDSYVKCGSSITNSHATGNVTSTASMCGSGSCKSLTIAVGGLVGVNANCSSIANSYAMGAVTALGTYLSEEPGSDAQTCVCAGGLVGANTGSIASSYASGPVSANYGAAGYGNNACAGGLVGLNSNAGSECGNSGLISLSYASGEVLASNLGCYGGLVGNSQGGTRIDQSHAIGTVLTTPGVVSDDVSYGGAFVGGLVGASAATITGSYATGGVALNTLGAAGGLVGCQYGGSIASSYATGAVSTANSSLVTSCGDGGGPLGVSVAAGGLVGLACGTHIASSHATGPVSFDTIAAAGGLAGIFLSCGGGDVSTIQSSYATGAVRSVNSAPGFVGGLVGANLGGAICGSHASGAVTGARLSFPIFGGVGGDTIGTINAVGGLVGLNAGVLYQTYATGAVSGSVFVGGLVGLNTPSFGIGPTDVGPSCGKITQSYATGTVTGYQTSAVGGLIGLNAAGTTVFDTYAQGEVAGATPDTGGTELIGGLIGLNCGSIATSYASGYVHTLSSGNSAGVFIGGLFGADEGEGNNYLYWDATTTKQTAGQSTQFSSGVVSGATMLGGTSGLDPLNRASYVGFDFLCVWNNHDEVTHPFFDFSPPAPILVTISGITISSKVYDGTASATILFGTPVLTGIAAADAGSITVLESGYTALFNNATAGTNKGVTITGLGLTGTDSQFYQLVQPTGLNGAITPAPLTITISANARTYNGTTLATLDTAGAVLNGLVPGDAVGVSASNYTAAFATAGVGVDKPVTVSGLDLTGAKSVNYTLTQPTGVTGTITPATLTINNLAAPNKIYDGTTTATVNGTGTLVGIVAGDSGKVALSGTPTGQFATPNVGTAIAVTVTGYSLTGVSSGNYTLTQPTLHANITVATLTIGGLSVQAKTYDGTKTATLAGTPTAIGAAAVDVGAPALLSIVGAGTGTFATANAGTNIVVTVSPYSLTGTDAGNYKLVQPTGFTGTITKAPVTITGGVTANNKIYDGTTKATLTFSGVTYSGLAASDVGLVSLNTAGYMASFATANAGTGLTVTVNGISFGGAAANNYTLTAPSTLTANITPAPLTVAGLTAVTRVYDGTTAATLDLSKATISGFKTTADATSITLSGTYTAAFVLPDAGTARAVTVSSVGLTGTGSSNYTAIGTNTKGIITPKVITVTPGSITVVTRKVNGTVIAQLVTSGATLVGLVGGDVVGVSGANYTATFDSAAAGARTVTVSILNLTGAKSIDYVIQVPFTLSGTITP